MMNCKLAQHQMALAVGDDLESSAKVALHGHLTDCPACQKQWQQHQLSFAVLQAARSEVLDTHGASSWPTISARLQNRPSVPQRAETSGWIAALAVAAASVVIYVFTQDGIISEGDYYNAFTIVRSPFVPSPASFDSANEALRWMERDQTDRMPPKRRPLSESYYRRDL